MTAVTISPFVPEYGEQIFNLILPIQREEFAINVTREGQPDLAQIPDFYQRGVGNFWVALHQNLVVGTIALKDIGNSQVALRKMFVRADFRGKNKGGIAQKLMDEIFSWAKATKIVDIYLGTTSAFLAAHRFYEKNGFVEIAKSVLPEKFPVMSVDTKFYYYQVREAT
jgi:N-acetylglutamate synthase-like GNAT family acetyltransferase